MKIIRGALSAADVSSPNIRYDADCDCLQFSPDGGTTWNPAPDSDPRHSPTFLKPPVAGSSKQCDAAANMVKWLHDFIDEMLFDFLLVGTVTTIINSILLELEILAPYIELLAIISELAETISAIGGTALAAAFTDDQYDLLLCIFFCHADGEGRVSAAALALIEDDITAQLNTTAALITNAILFVQGEIGLSNAGSVGSETGACDDCNCGWDGCVDFRTGLHSWNILNFGTINARGQQIDGVGVETTGVGDSPTEVYIYRTFTALPLTRVIIHGHHFMSGTPFGHLYFLLGGTVINNVLFFPPGVDGEANDWVITWAGSETCDQIQLTTTEPGGGAIAWLEFHGTDDTAPGWVDACP